MGIICALEYDVVPVCGPVKHPVGAHGGTTDHVVGIDGFLAAVQGTAVDQIRHFIRRHAAVQAKVFAIFQAGQNGGGYFADADLDAITVID